MLEKPTAAVITSDMLEKPTVLCCSIWKRKPTRSLTKQRNNSDVLKNKMLPSLPAICLRNLLFYAVQFGRESQQDL
jgi:hypothetical protein